MKFIKIPFSQGSLGKNSGCELAPNKILSNTDNAKECIIEKYNFDNSIKNIEKCKADFFIGGDHSITYYLFKTFAKEQKNKNKIPCLIIFDAHADCSTIEKPITHQDFNSNLINDKILSPENLLLIGTRKIYASEKKFIKKYNIKVIEQKEINNLNPKELANRIIEFSKNKQVYLSIDIDVLDPIEAPGTGYIEKNGMKLDFLLKVLKKIKHIVKKTDLVEINPTKEGENGQTVLAGKKIVQVFF